MKLTVSLAQIAITPGEPEENLKKGEALLAQAVKKKSELICFPEMWTTGFDWEKNAHIAKEQEKIIAQVASLAQKYNIWINGSMLAANDNGKASNTSFLFNSAGKEIARYSKTHLFSFMHEEEHMAPGKSLAIAETPWGKIGLSICYDIRFPELFRTYALKGARVILSPMAFPNPRLEHWKILVRARAIENQLFMIGTNRVGSETIAQNGKVTYCGHSTIIDPWGETMVEGGEKKEELLTATIDLDKVEDIRSKMKVLADRRPELYELK